MSFTIAEYQCDDCGRFEALVDRPAPDIHSCPICGSDSEWTISAPLGRVKLGEVTQGKVTKAEVPTWTDTEPLASGMSMKEWKERRRKVWWDNDRKKRKQKGLDEYP